MSEALMPGQIIPGKVPKLLIVIPTYGHFDYAAQAITSAMENTLHCEPHVIVVDDASPELDAITPNTASFPPHYLKLTKTLHHYRQWCTYHRFPTNGGLTRSWNYGLQFARAADRFEYVCVTNSDVYFPNGWNIELFQGLREYALVGPVTNAPGTETMQHVDRYSMLYDRKVNDIPSIAKIQNELIIAQCHRYREMTLNGFCLLAKTTTWWANAYSSFDVFNPYNAVNSKGEPNPTPLMTLNEYELQRRWHAAGLKSAACLGSYVYHYRAVSRGDKYKRGDWSRLPETK